MGCPGEGLGRPEVFSIAVLPPIARESCMFAVAFPGFFSKDFGGGGGGKGEIP